MNSYGSKVLLTSIMSIIVASTVLVAEETVKYEPRDGVINLYGAGGPHTAFIRVAKVFTDKTGIKVKVNFGPEHKWTQNAKKNADIIWGTAEQSTTAFLENYKEFDSKNVEPIYIRRAVIAVPIGNPKNIKGFDDLIKSDMKIIVTEGAGVYNTSGTGVWEDVAGRLGKLSDVKAFRKNIIVYAKGSGASFRAFKSQKADAWITWAHWPLTHPKDAQIVEISEERAIYRDLTVVTNEKSDLDTPKFLAFLKGKEALEIFQSEGWKGLE
ncbi:MAG TPA: accessory colonization factor [Sulfurovum sp.]|nr:accessory colonization factor [Sulfurovum sp.]